MTSCLAWFNRRTEPVTATLPPLAVGWAVAFVSDDGAAPQVRHGTVLLPARSVLVLVPRKAGRSGTAAG